MSHPGMFSSRVTPALFLLSLFILASYVDAKTKTPAEPIASVIPVNFSSSTSPKNVEGRSLVLVEPPPVVLTYHGGALLTAGPVIPVFFIWYGGFTKGQRAILTDFIASFSLNSNAPSPSVKSWWKITSGYKSKQGLSVAPSLSIAGQVSYKASGKPLSNADIQVIVSKSLKKFPVLSNGIYVVLTAKNVIVEDFCMNSCASHFASDKAKTKGKQIPYILVSNPATQCPGLCAWPYAKPAYGPPDFVPLLPPNGDVGIDGMVINLGSMLAGVATNPFDTGFFQGDASDPLEAATACTAIYGAGSYPGYPGNLLVDPKTKVSYNVHGANYRKFLLSWLWNPTTSLCTPP